MANQPQALASEARHKKILTIVFTIICIVWVLPVVCVAVNSFKLNTFVKTETFALPPSPSPPRRASPGGPTSSPA